MRRDNRQRQIALQVSIALAAGMFSMVPAAWGAPAGGSSVTASISYSDVKNSNNVVIGQDTNITSSTANNVIDWHDFSVGKDETVTFDSGAKTNNYMNVVTGANTSDINGKIVGGNEVYIVNPNGVIFGKDASVDVGSLYVSTRGDAVVQNAAGNAADFSATKTNLITAASSVNGAAMDVVNMGKISADKVVLEGENIRLLNSADITAANGVTLRADEADNGYIHVGNTGTVAAGYTAEKLTSNSSNSAASIEHYTLVDNTNWSSTLGTGKAVSGNYMLADDINASAISGFKGVASFTGKVDGNFHKISKVSNLVGLFTTTQNATIENLGVVNSTFKNSSKQGAAGAIVSVANSGTVLNKVYNEGSTVNGYNAIYSGGLVGAANGVTIKNSYNTGNIYNGNGGALIGAVTGGTNSVKDSYSTGNAFGLVFRNKSAGSLSFENVLGTGQAFFSSTNSAPTGKNSLVVGTNVYAYADANGNIVSVNSSAIDKTALSTYTSAGITALSSNDITDTGGLKYSGTKLIRPAWRIYEGKTAPVLTAFQQGIKNTVYNYEYFDSTNTIDQAAYKYNNGQNNGADMTPYIYATSSTSAAPGLVYNGDTLKIVDSSSTPAASNATTKVVNDLSTVFKMAANGESTVDASHVFYNSAGQRDATYTPPAVSTGTGTQNKMAFIWSDQKGYDLVGNNISIAPRQVNLSNNLSGLSIVKEYDGSYDAKNYVPGLFSGTSTTSTGVLPVDSSSIKVGWDNTSSPTAIFVNKGGTTGDANVDADKQVLINGKILLTDGNGNAYTGSNYVIVDGNGNPVSSVQLNTTVDAAIYQRQLQVSFIGNAITKTYDKDEYVKDSSGNLRSFGRSDFNFDTTNLVNGDNVDLSVSGSNNAVYVDKTTGAVQINVGTHDVAVGGVTLTGTSAKNYTLVDANGTPVYSELGIVTGFQQQGSPIGLSGGTFYASGDITLRSLGDTGYKWFKTTTNGTPNYETAVKEYDGTSNYADPGTFYVSNAGSSSASATTGMVAGDLLDFQVTSAEFTNDSTTVNSTAVRDANTSNTPQGVRYTVAITGASASNYTFDSQALINAGTAAPLSNGGTAQVMGEGNITPRTIYVTTPQANPADKYYDGDNLVKDANGNTTFNLNSGYLSYANNNTYQQLVSGDGSSIEITGVYKITGTEAADKDVNYNAANTNNPVQQKNITYTAKIMQNNSLSPNYIFNISNSNQASFNGVGTIKQVQLGAVTFDNNISKTYDGSAVVTNTNNAAAPQITNDEIKMNTPTGIISSENISDVFYVDSNGYLDATGQSLLANGSFTANYGDVGSTGFTPNPNVKRDPQNLSTILPRDVEYSGISNLMKNHNYALNPTTAASDTVYGTGTINPFLVTNKSWITLDRNSTAITKTYDGTDTITSPMSYLNTTGNNKASATVTTPAGKVLPGLASTVAGAKYSSRHSNNNTAQNVIYEVNISETGNYGIDPSLKNQAGNVELTLVGDGLITQKHIIATTPKDPNVTKTYDATDAISKTGNALVDISNDILPIDQNTVTNATTAKYIANANGAAADASANNGDKTVEYTLALNGNTYQDYLFDDGSGNNTITGAGTINKRNLVISGNTNHAKTYDKTTVVTDMPTTLAGFTFGDPQDVTVLGLDNFDITKLSGTYGTGTTDASFTSNTNAGSWDVQYDGFFTALGSRAGNYTVNGVSANSGSNGTAYGHGVINKAAFSGSFIFKLLGGINRIYSGAADVGQLEANTTAADKDAFERQWVDTANSGVDINGDNIIDDPLSNSAYTYTINSAVFADADVGQNKTVTYQITISPASLQNYSGAPASLSLSDSITNGEIKAREITVDLTTLAKNGLTKNYDAAGVIYNNDNKAYSTDTAVGTVLSGSSIVTFDPVDTVNHTGLVKGTNASTGAYTNFDAGSNKVIEYTADIAGDNVSNYIFKDKSGNTLTNGQGAALTTNNNTINPFGVVLTTNPVNKTYDGTTNVTQAMAQGALQLGSTVGGQTVALQNGYTGQYDNPNVNPDAQGNPGIHTVTYEGLDLGDNNYKLVDASGQTLNLDSNNLYTIDGTGTIDPAAWNGQFIFKLKNGINQIYSGSADVGQLESNTTAADKDTFRRQWVDLTASGIDVDNDGTVDIDLNAGGYTYTINSAAFAAGADVGINKTVDYNITLNPQNLTNYIGVPTTANLTDSITDGEIKAREIIVDLTTLAKNGLTKNYDAAGAIYNNDNKAYSTDTATGTVLSGSSIVTFDLVDTVNHTGLVKGTNASIGAYTNFDAGSNKVIEYTADIAGDNVSNYIFKDKSGNTLTNGQGAALTTNNNTIDPFGVVLTTNAVNKTYDGTTNVTQAMAQSALQLGSAVGGQTVSLQNINANTGRYDDPNVNPDAQGNPGIHTVTYTGLDLGDSNYKLVDASGQTLNLDSNNLYTIDGTGTIDPAAWSGQFIFKLKNGINQIYSGSADVGQLENNTTTADKDTFRRQWVDLANSGADLDNDGNVDIALTNGGYSITKAVFTAGPDAGQNKQVEYTISLNPVVLNNYTNTPASVVLSDSINDGEIKQRDIFVDLTALAKNGLTKNYDGTGAVYNNDNKAYSTDTANGTVLTGSSIVEFAPVDAANHTGLIAGTNDSTGEYTPNVDAGGNRIIEYTAKVGGVNSNNYVLKDKNGQVLTNGQGAALITNNNTINAFGVVLTADPISKVYDGTVDVVQAKSQGALHLGATVNGDVVSLQNINANTGSYDDPNVNPDANGNPGIHTVNYKGLGFSGSTNYKLVDSSGNDLQQDANGLYEFAGTGIITPFQLTADDVTIDIDDAQKTYDAARDVLKNGILTDLTNNYITNHYVTLSNGNKETLDFTSYNAEYNHSNATANPVNPGSQVNYRLGLSNSNYDFSALQSAGLVNGNNEWLTSTGGTIDKAVVQASLTNSPLDSTIVKDYDGDAGVLQDVTDKVSVTGLFTNDDGTVLNVQAVNAQYADKNVARDANGNVIDKDVYYHVELSGDARDNYEIVGAAGADYASLTDNTGILTGSGRINPKEITVDFKLAERTYDGTDTVYPADIQVEKFNGLAGKDSITLDNTAMATITGQYEDANVNRKGDAVGYKSVSYAHVADAFNDYVKRNLNSDAANYMAAQDTSYTEADAKGKINPLELTELKAKWQARDKVYDAAPDILDNEGTMTLAAYSPLDGSEIEVAYDGKDSGVYADQYGDAVKDVGSHALRYTVSEVAKNLGNYQLSDSTAAAAQRNWFSTTANDNVDNQSVTGKITPLTLEVIAGTFHKVYDGTEDIADSDVRSKIGFSEAAAAVLQNDHDVDYDVTAHYEGSDAGGRTVDYTLTINNNIKGNYVLQGAVNDIFTGKTSGTIDKRKVYVLPVDITGIDKVYDGTDKLASDYTNQGRFKLADYDVENETGIVALDNLINLDLDAITGEYASAHVKLDDDGKAAAQDITFHNFQLTNDNGNYTLEPVSLTGSGRITPRALTVGIKESPVKVYDGETALSETYTANSNLDLQGILDNDNANLLIESAAYADANAGTKKDYTYAITIDNPDYELTQGANAPDITVTAAGQAGTITAHDGTITPRVLSIESIAAMNKVYDGTTDGVENAAANITLGNYIAMDKGNLGLTAVAVYDNANAGISEDSDELENHKVTYTLSLNNGNYQLAEDVVTGEGKISRKGLHIVAAPASVNIGEPMPEFEGTVEGLLPADSGLADSFSFAPYGNTTTNIPGSYAVYGWYSSRISGNMGLNYTFVQDAGNDTAFTVNYINTAANNPDTKIAPNNDVYKQMSKDMSSGFGDNGAAAIEYRDKSGNVVATETIDSGEIHGVGTLGEANDDAAKPNTSLAKIGIVGGDIVNIEGADAASTAAIEVSGDGSIINLEVLPLQEESTTQKSGAAEITGTDTITNTNASIAQIRITDDARELEENEDKAEAREKEGEIAIESSDSQKEDEIQLEVEDEGVNVA